MVLKSTLFYNYCKQDLYEILFKILKQKVPMHTKNVMHFQLF